MEPEPTDSWQAAELNAAAWMAPDPAESSSGSTAAGVVAIIGLLCWALPIIWIFTGGYRHVWWIDVISVLGVLTVGLLFFGWASHLSDKDSSASDSPEVQAEDA